MSLIGQVGGGKAPVLVGEEPLSPCGTWYVCVLHELCDWQAPPTDMLALSSSQNGCGRYHVTQNRSEAGTSWAQPPQWLGSIGEANEWLLLRM